MWNVSDRLWSTHGGKIEREFGPELAPVCLSPIEAGGRVGSFGNNVHLSNNWKVVRSCWSLFRFRITFYKRGEEVSATEDIIRARKVAGAEGLECGETRRKGHFHFVCFDELN